MRGRGLEAGYLRMLSNGTAAVMPNGGRAARLAATEDRPPPTPGVLRDFPLVAAGARTRGSALGRRRVKGWS